MPSLVNKKPISVTLDSNGNPTTLVEFSDTVSTRHVVPLIHGGTGADTASGARTSLGLGSLSTLSTITVSQLANNIDASGIGFIAYKAEQLEKKGREDYNDLGFSEEEMEGLFDVLESEFPDL